MRVVVILVLLCHVLHGFRRPSIAIPRQSIHSSIKLRRLPTNVFLQYSSQQRNSITCLFAEPKVGDVVLAEVEDIGGSIKEPKAFFKVFFCCRQCSMICTILSVQFLIYLD